MSPWFQNPDSATGPQLEQRLDWQPAWHAVEAPDSGKVMDAGSSEGTIHLYRPRGGQDDVPAGAIKTFSVGRHMVLSTSELHRFRSHNQILIRSLASRLSLFLRMEFSMEVTSLEIIELQKYNKLVQSPRHMILYKFNPLDCLGAIDIEKPMALTIADRMLGGKAFSVNPDRTIREVETALVDQIVLIMLREWCKYWQYSTELRPSIVGHESNAQFLTIGLPDDSFYHMVIEACLGDCVAQIQFLLPVRGLDPLLHSIHQDAAKAADVMETEEFITPELHWNHNYDSVKIKVNAEWSDLPILSGDLLALKPGDIISLDAARLGKVQINVAGVPKYFGRLGNVDNHCAVQITEPILSQS